MNEASDILIAMGVDTTTAPLLLCAVPLFVLVLASVILWRWRLPKADALIGSDVISEANKDFWMLIEILPRELGDIVRKTRPNANDSSLSYDPCGYESLDDAILNVQDVAASALRYVKPENLFLVFGQTVESLRGRFFQPLYLPSIAPTREQLVLCPNNQGDDGKDTGHKECSAYPRALVFCKLVKSEANQSAIRGIQNNAGSNGDYGEITWSKLQELRDRCGNSFDHSMHCLLETNV